MRKFVFFSFLFAVWALVSSCSAGRGASQNSDIRNSVWVNLSPTEMNSEKSMVINSMCFTDDNHVIMKSGVGNDSTIIVAPLFTGCGTYSCSGSIKKGMTIKIDTDVTTIGKKINYEGLITPEGMILVHPDSTTSVYYRIKTSNN